MKTTLYEARIQKCSYCGSPASWVTEPGDYCSCGRPAQWVTKPGDPRFSAHRRHKKKYLCYKCRKHRERKWISEAPYEEILAAVNDMGCFMAANQDHYKRRLAGETPTTT